MADKTRSKGRALSLPGGVLPGAAATEPVPQPDATSPPAPAGTNNAEMGTTLALILKRLDGLEEVRAAMRRIEEKTATFFSDYEQDMVIMKKQLEENKTTRQEATRELTTMKRDLQVTQNELAVTIETNKRLETQINDLVNIQRIRNIRLDGKKETQNENLKSAVLELSSDLGLTDITMADIEAAYRVGKPNQQNTRPRTILITFNTERLRNKFFFARASLKNKDKYKGIFLNDDVSLITRKQRDDYRAVAALARQDGATVRVHTDGIVLDGEKYLLTEPQSLPEKYGISKAKTFELNGEVYFASEASFLSNFSPSTILDGNTIYRTAEHLYQARKCEHVGALDKKKLVLAAPTALEAKRIADKIGETAEWRTVRDRVMEEVIEAKFDQNPELAKKLTDTGEMMLNEATHNDHFGIGVTLLAREIKDKSYRGTNMLGRLLMAKRTSIKATNIKK